MLPISKLYKRALELPDGLLVALIGSNLTGKASVYDLAPHKLRDLAPDKLRYASSLGVALRAGHVTRWERR